MRDWVTCAALVSGETIGETSGETLAGLTGETIGGFTDEFTDEFADNDAEGDAEDEEVQDIMGLGKNGSKISKIAESDTDVKISY